MAATSGFAESLYRWRTKAAFTAAACDVRHTLGISPVSGRRRHRKKWWCWPWAILGGRELNVSFDIETLIFAFPSKGETRGRRRR